MGQHRQVTVGQAGFGWFLTTFLWVTQFIQSCSYTQSLGRAQCWWHFISIPDVGDLRCVSDDELLKCLGLGQPWSTVYVANGLEEAAVLYGMVIHPSSTFFKKRFLCLFERQRVSERENEWNVWILHLWLLPMWLEQLGLGKLKSEARDSVSKKVAGANDLSHFLLLSLVH